MRRRLSEAAPYNRCWVRELLGYPIEVYRADAPVSVSVRYVEPREPGADQVLVLRCGQWDALLMQTFLRPDETHAMPQWMPGNQPLF